MQMAQCGNLRKGLQVKDNEQAKNCRCHRDRVISLLDYLIHGPIDDNLLRLAVSFKVFSSLKLAATVASKTARVTLAQRSF
jgi:hypothetical protein